MSSTRAHTLKWAKAMGLVMLGPTPNLPSLVTHIAPGLRGARWWSHPQANEIYNTYRQIIEDRDIAVAKLVDGKITLLHRKLWPAIIKLVQDEMWRKKQIGALSLTAKSLLDHVESAGSIRLDFLAPDWPRGVTGLKKDRNILEKKALVMSRDEHTKTGTHQTVLESWESFRNREHIKVPRGLRREKALEILKPYLGPRKSVFE